MKKKKKEKLQLPDFQNKVRQKEEEVLRKN